MSLTDVKLYTFGAEIEVGNIDRRKGFPEGDNWKFDKRDTTILNSNGLAVWMGKPTCESDYFGGEINTPPTKTIKGQVAKFQQILDLYPEAVVNHRSNLHIHVRIPGLKDNLAACKRIQKYVHDNIGYLDVIEPIPKPVQDNFSSEAEYEGAVRRFKRRQVSHHKMLTTSRFKKAQKARTFDEFFAAEAPLDKEGKPLMHLAPRCAVNIRQLKETDTIEFRHFPGTLDPVKFGHCVRWCRDFLLEALTTRRPAVQLFEDGEYDFPKFKKYVHWLEVGYRMTVHDGSIPKEKILKNVQKILADPELLKKTSGSLLDLLPKIKNREPRIFQIRGSSGSGKSTLVFNILHNYGGKVVYLGEDVKAVGYIVSSLKLFIVGDYFSPTGGCDGIKTAHHAMFRILSAYKQGYNVLFEGLLLSGLVDLPQKLSEGRNVTYLALSTPLEVCLKRVAKRRATRGVTEPMNPKNTENKWDAVRSSFKTLKASGLDIHMMKNSEAYEFIIEALGKEVVDFDPAVQKNYGERMEKKAKDE